MTTTTYDKYDWVASDYNTLTSDDATASGTESLSFSPTAATGISAGACPVTIMYNTNYAACVEQQFTVTRTMSTSDTADVEFYLQNQSVGAGWILFGNTIYNGGSGCSSTMCAYSDLIASSNYYSSGAAPYTVTFSKQIVPFLNFTVGDYTWEANSAMNGVNLLAGALAVSTFSLLQ